MVFVALTKSLFMLAMKELLKLEDKQELSDFFGKMK